MRESCRHYCAIFECASGCQATAELSEGTDPPTLETKIENGINVMPGKQVSMKY